MSERNKSKIRNTGRQTIHTQKKDEGVEGKALFFFYLFVLTEYISTSEYWTEYLNQAILTDI